MLNHNEYVTANSMQTLRFHHSQKENTQTSVVIDEICSLWF